MIKTLIRESFSAVALLGFVIFVLPIVMFINWLEDEDERDKK